MRAHDNQIFHPALYQCLGQHSENNPIGRSSLDQQTRQLYNDITLHLVVLENDFTLSRIKEKTEALGSVDNLQITTGPPTDQHNIIQ